jgi:hypothetical protein
MTVANQINPSDYYFVVFSNTNQQTPTSGPVPVVGLPWGNGFVAGAGTSFVEYNGSQPGDGYALYSFVPGTNLQTYSGVGVPTQDTPVTTGSNTLEFQIPLSELATASVSAASTNYLQINIITTNLLPVDSQTTSFPPGTKLFDALGATTSAELTGYVTISTAQAGTYTNTTLGSNDAAGGVVSALGGGVVQPATGGDAPNLDITSWSATITN